MFVLVAVAVVGFEGPLCLPATTTTTTTTNTPPPPHNSIHCFPSCTTSEINRIVPATTIDDVLLEEDTLIQ